MSSLAEINKELQKQSTDIAEMKKNIAAQLKAEIDARKEFKRGAGQREEASREAQKKAPKGFIQGFTRGSGIAGASGLIDSFLKGFFGAGSGILAAILGSVGLVAGKLLKGTLLLSLVSTFGETVIKKFFASLKDTSFDFNLTKQQEDSIAKKTTDGIFGFLVSKLLFRNPLIAIGVSIITMFKKDILGAVYKLFGIEEINLGAPKDGKTLKYKNIFGEGTIDIPKMSENMTNIIIAAVSGFLLYITTKVTSMVGWLLRGGQSKAEAKLNKLLKTQESKFLRQLDEMEQRIKMQQDAIARQNKYGTSRTASGIKAQEILDTKAKQLDLLSKISTSAPEFPVAPQAGSRAAYVTKAGKAIDVDIIKKLPGGLVQVQGPAGNKFAVDPEMLKSYPQTTKAPKGVGLLRSLGIFAQGLGKISPAIFGLTAGQNIRSGMYGDMNPVAATGVEFLAGPGDLLDMINYLPDKALEALGVNFRFGTGAGQASRQAIQSFLGSKYIPPALRERLGTQQSNVPKIDPYLLLSPAQRQAADLQMIPSADTRPIIINNPPANINLPAYSGKSGEVVPNATNYYHYEKRLGGAMFGHSDAELRILALH
jgi:hypothetical protein